MSTWEWSANPAWYNGTCEIEFAATAAGRPLLGYQCSVYVGGELLPDVTNVLVRLDAAEIVTAGVTLAHVSEDRKSFRYEQKVYEVTEVRVRGAAGEARGEHVSRMAHLRMLARDRLRAALDGCRRLSR